MKNISLIAIIFCLTTSLVAQGNDPLADPEIAKLIAERKSIREQKEALLAKEEEISKKIAEKSGAVAREAELKKYAWKLPENIHRGWTPQLEDKVTSGIVKFMDDNNVLVRRSVKDQNRANLPALLQWTRDGNAGESWLSDVGVSTQHDLGENLMWGAFGEYHYNNAVGGLKDTLLAGGSIDFLPSGDTFETAQYFRLNAAFKRDNLVAGEGVVTELLYFPYVPAMKIGNVWGNEFFCGQISPVIGIQYESGNGAVGFGSGHRVTARAGIGFTGSILPDYLGNRLTIDSQLLYWHHLDNQGSFAAYGQDQFYWVNSLTYWLNTPSKKTDGLNLHPDDHHFGITLGYSYGDNPDEGDFNADLLTVGLSVRF
jgi:hypothetical protein